MKYLLTKSNENVNKEIDTLHKQKVLKGCGKGFEFYGNDVECGEEFEYKGKCKVILCSECKVLAESVVNSRHSLEGESGVLLKSVGERLQGSLNEGSNPSADV